MKKNQSWIYYPEIKLFNMEDSLSFRQFQANSSQTASIT